MSRLIAFLLFLTVFCAIIKAQPTYSFETASKTVEDVISENALISVAVLRDETSSPGSVRIFTNSTLSTATEAIDYLPLNQVLSFDAGESQKSFNVVLIGSVYDRTNVVIVLELRYRIVYLEKKKKEFMLFYPLS